MGGPSEGFRNYKKTAKKSIRRRNRMNIKTKTNEDSKGITKQCREMCDCCYGKLFCNEKNKKNRIQKNRSKELNRNREQKYLTTY